MKLLEILNDSLPIITKFAPTIGASIGGPIGLASGYILSLLADTFGTSSSDLRSLAQKIVNDPHAQTKLEALETKHGNWISQLENNSGNLSKAEIHINLEWQSDQK